MITTFRCIPDQIEAIRGDHIGAKPVVSGVLEILYEHTFRENQAGKNSLTCF